MGAVEPVAAALVLATAVATVLVIALGRARREALAWRRWALLMRAASPEAAHLIAAPQFDWDVVRVGGNLKLGRFSDRGSCPCQHSYNVASLAIPLRRVPPWWQRPPWQARYPPAPPPLWECPEGCVPVRIETWRAWAVMRHRQTRAVQLECSTYAQYHCREPVPAEPPHEPGPIET